MQRPELMELLGQLKLAGMRAHSDDVVTTGRKRQRAFEVIFGELLRAEIAEKQARSIRHQLGIAKLPLAKELTDFAFADAPVNQAGIVRLRAWVAKWANEQPVAKLSWLPIPVRDHQPRGLALSPIRSQLPGCRGPARPAERAVSTPLRQPDSAFTVATPRR